MTDKPIVDGWVTTDRAAQLSGYGLSYIRRLASRGRIPAYKVGRDWLVELDSLLAHKAQMDALGTKASNPWREDLTRQGRGRKRNAGQR